MTDPVRTYLDHAQSTIAALEERRVIVERRMLAVQGVDAELIPLQAEWDRLEAARGSLVRLVHRAPQCGHRYEDGATCYLAEGHRGAHEVTTSARRPAWTLPKPPTEPCLCGPEHRADCPLCRGSGQVAHDCSPPHQAQDGCGSECYACSLRDCPHREPLHYHHDGCPACYQDEIEASVRELRGLGFQVEPPSHPAQSRVLEPVQDHHCRRCAVCVDCSHHWMEGFDDDEEGELIDPDEVRWQCKHCPFSMPYEYKDMDTQEPEAMYQARKRDGLILPPQGANL